LTTNRCLCVFFIEMTIYLALKGPFDNQYVKKAFVSRAKAEKYLLTSVYPSKIKQHQQTLSQVPKEETISQWLNNDIEEIELDDSSE
jgi:hypothetical protein